MPIFHPYPDDEGKPVAIKRPSTPTEIEAWADPAASLQLCSMAGGGPS